MVGTTRSAPIPLDIFGLEEEQPPLEVSNSADTNGWGGDHAAASTASVIASFSKGDAVWYRQRDSTHVAAKVVSVDLSVDPPSYGVAFLDGSQGVRETEAPRLRRRSPQDTHSAAVANGHGGVAGQSSATAASTDVDEEDFGDFAEAASSLGAPEALPAPHAEAAASAHQLAIGLHHASQASSAAALALSHAGHNSSMSPAQCRQEQDDNPAAARGEQGWAWQGSGVPAARQPLCTTSCEEHIAASFSTLPPAPVWGMHHGSMPMAALQDDSAMTFGAFAAADCAEAQQQGTPRWAGANGHSATPASGLMLPPSDGGFALSAAAGWAGAQEEGTPRWLGAKRHRVTPTSVLSLPPSDADSSSSDEDFGDFKAAAQQAAGAAGAPADVDRSAPLPLSLFGEEEDLLEAGALPPNQDLALPWSGFPLAPPQPLPAPHTEHPLQLLMGAAPSSGLLPTGGLQHEGTPAMAADSAQPAAPVGAAAARAVESDAAATDSFSTGAGAAACAEPAGHRAFAGGGGPPAAALDEEPSQLWEPHAAEEERAGPAVGVSMSAGVLAEEVPAEGLRAGGSAQRSPERLGIDWDAMDFSFAEDPAAAAGPSMDGAVDASICAADPGGGWSDAAAAAQHALNGGGHLAAEAASSGTAMGSGEAQGPQPAGEERVPGRAAEEEEGASEMTSSANHGAEDPSGGSDWEFGNFAAAGEEDAASASVLTGEEDSLQVSSLAGQPAAAAYEGEAMHWGGPVVEEAAAAGWGDSWGAGEGALPVAPPLGALVSDPSGKLQEEQAVHEEAAAPGWGDSWHDGQGIMSLPSKQCPAAAPEVLCQDGAEDPALNQAAAAAAGEAEPAPAALHPPGPGVDDASAAWGAAEAWAAPEEAAVLRQPAGQRSLPGGWGETAQPPEQVSSAGGLEGAAEPADQLSLAGGWGDEWATAQAAPAQAPAPLGLESPEHDLWGVLASLDDADHTDAAASGREDALPAADAGDAAGREAAMLEDPGALSWAADRWHTWHRVMQAAVAELELGARLWAEGCAAAEGGTAELLSGDGWRRYMTALGHVHLVALVLRQAAAGAAAADEDASSEAEQLTKGWQRCLGHWQLSVPGRCSLAEAYASVCASACPVVAWAPAAHAAATRLASIGAAHEGAAPPVQGCCGISLLPLALVPGVPTVLCNGVRGLAPLANLWANRVREEAFTPVVETAVRDECES